MCRHIVSAGDQQQMRIRLATATLFHHWPVNQIITDIGNIFQRNGQVFQQIAKDDQLIRLNPLIKMDNPSSIGAAIFYKFSLSSGNNGNLDDIGGQSTANTVCRHER